MGDRLRVWAVILAFVGAVIGFGCEVPLDISELECDDIVDDVVELSQKQTNPFQSKILKIYDVKQVSRIGERLTCEGLALLDSGSEQNVEFYSYADADGDTFIGYEGK